MASDGIFSVKLIMLIDSIFGVICRLERTIRLIETTLGE